LSKSVCEKLLAFFTEFNKIFEVWKIEPKKVEELVIPKEIIEIAELRLQARKQKNWKESDILRQKLLDAGMILKTVKNLM